MSWFSNLFGTRRSPEARTASRPEFRPSVSKRQSSASPLEGLSGLRVVGKGGYPRNVVGESNYQDVLSKMCGGHNREGHDLETAASLIPEPSNLYDPNAVMVVIHGQKVGYLSREDAPKYLKALEAAGHTASTALVAAKIVGGWRTNQHDAGHFGVKLALPWPATFSA